MNIGRTVPLERNEKECNVYNTIVTIECASFLLAENNFLSSVYGRGCAIFFRIIVPIRTLERGFGEG